MSIENADHLKQQEVRLTQKIKELAEFINSDDAIIEARKEKHASRVDGVVKMFIERVLAGEEEAAHNLISTFSRTLRPETQISEKTEQFWIDTIVQSRKELEDIFKPEEEKVAAVEETPEVPAPAEPAIENKEPPEEIPGPPAIPEPPTATYEFTDDTKDEEPDAKIAAETKPKVARSKSTKKSMTTPKAPTPKINRPAGLSDEELAKELRGRQADETIKTMKKGDVFSFMGAEAKVIGFDKKTKQVKLETRLGEKIYTKEEFKEALKEGEYETKNSKEVAQQATIQEIAKYMQEHGIDRVVVHGEPRYEENPDTGEQEPVKTAMLDFDTQIALYFLNYGQEFKQRRKGERGASTIYNSGADTEFVMKGEKSKLTRPATKNGVEIEEPLKKGSFVLHIDTGRRTLSIEKDGELVMAFADHHKETDDTRTSAGDIVLRIMNEAKAYEVEPWMEKLGKFTNEVDNLSYADSKNFKPPFFQAEWPKSLEALYSYLPYQKVIELIKEGRDPKQPFKDEEFDTVFTEIRVKDKKSGKYVEKKVSIRELITLRGNHAADSMKYLDVAAEEMKKQGILTESAVLGKTVFATMDDETNAKGEKIPGNYLKEGYLAAKAKGYDTFATYSKGNNSFFINSTTKDLRPIIKEIRKIVPGAKLVRGVMVLPGKDAKGRDKLTKEKFLEICGLLNKDTKLNTYAPKIKVLSEKAQAYQKEKARVQLEEKIEDLEKKVKEKMREAEILDQDAKINEIHLKAIRDEIEAIEKMEREIAQEEENAELATTMAKAREIRSTVPLSTAPVKATESLVKYEAPNKTQLKWLNDEELIQNKKLVEERIEEINKKTYTVQDLRDVGKERDAIEYARRMHKLQKGENNKEYTILTDKLEVAQKIYSTIEKKL